jgi:hypothetical protein
VILCLAAQSARCDTVSSCERSLYGPITGARNGCQLDSAATVSLNVARFVSSTQHANSLSVVHFCYPTDSTLHYLPALVSGIELSHGIFLTL